MPNDKELSELVHPSNEGFAAKVTPKKPDDSLFMFECKKEIHIPGAGPESDPYRTSDQTVICKGIHFRHAGYVELMLPFIKPGGTKEMALDSRQVMLCVKCKNAYVWVGEQMYDVTDRIDLKAWEKTEKEAFQATGPGGQC